MQLACWHQEFLPRKTHKTRRRTGAEQIFQHLGLLHLVDASYAAGWAVTVAVSIPRSGFHGIFLSIQRGRRDASSRAPMRSMASASSGPGSLIFFQIALGHEIHTRRC